MSETWVPAPGYGGLYEISDLGRVRSMRFKTRRILRLQQDRYGYACVRLYGSLGARKTAKVHRLVCEAFNGSPLRASDQVAHLDHDKANNTPSNLAWVTQSENAQQNVERGILPPPGSERLGELHPGAKLTEAAVHEIRRKAELGQSTRSIAREHGISQSQVSAITTRRSWGHV
jgi:hypothetical protein